MRLIDLSQPVFDNCPNCPAHPAARVDIIDSHIPSHHESWHMELLTFTSHTGSHVDAPLHKLPGGASLDDIPLEQWQGPALIFDFRGITPREGIDGAMLAERITDDADVRDAFCLLATGWGQKRAKTQEWLQDMPFLTADGANWLVEHEVRGVGIDHWSIGDANTHAVLLSGPVLIVEELHFPSEVFSLRRPFEFWALPIHLRGHSGAPCRPVIAVREQA
jgi:arylformamidase